MKPQLFALVVLSATLACGKPAEDATNANDTNSGSGSGDNAGSGGDTTTPTTTAT